MIFFEELRNIIFGSCSVVTLKKYVKYMIDPCNHKKITKNDFFGIFVFDFRACIFLKLIFEINLHASGIRNLIPKNKKHKKNTTIISTLKNNKSPYT